VTGNSKKAWPAMIALAVLLMGGAVRVEAYSVTMEFIGQVDYVNNIPGVAIGDIVRGRYTFDSTLPNTGVDPAVGLYESNGTFSLSVGSVSFSVSPYLIGVGNDVSAPAGTHDFYSVEGKTVIAGVDYFYQMFLGTFDLSQGAITSTALPLIPPEVAKFEDFRRFGYCYGVTGPARCTEHGIGGPILSLTLVDGPVTSVPTINPIGLTAMALLLVMGALRSLRRFRRAR
jgi:hypothetical protein